MSLMKNLIFILLLVVSVRSQVSAQDSGRLRDGRAYRTDEQGYRLIDQLAEYEVKVRELKTQLYTLEDELVEKNKAIVSCRNISEKQNKLDEEDLLKKSAQKAATVCEPKIVYKEKIKLVEKECAETVVQEAKSQAIIECPEAKCTEDQLAALKTEILSCEAAKSGLALKIEEKETRLASLKIEQEKLAQENEQLTQKKEELVVEREKLALANEASNKRLEVSLNKLAKKEQSLANLEKSLASLENNYKKEQEKLAKLSSSLELEKQSKVAAQNKVNDLSAKLASLNSDLLRNNSKLKEKNLELTQLKTKLEERLSDLALLEKKNSKLSEQYSRAKLEKKKKKEAIVLASVQQSEAKAKVEETKPVVVAAKVNSSPQIITNDKFGLKAKLSLIDQKISERKSLSDRAREKASYIQIKHSPLVTALGVSLDTLRAREQRVRTRKQGLRVAAGLTEIEKILREDIELFKRLAGI